MSQNFKKALQAEMGMHGVTFLMIAAAAIITLVLITVTILDTIKTRTMLREQSTQTSSHSPDASDMNIYFNKPYGRTN